MTVPWLMNCAHQPDGWCLECVAKLWPQDIRDLMDLVRHHGSEKSNSEILAMYYHQRAVSIGKRLRPIEDGDPFSTPGTYEP